jgi:hypothetical protein
MSGKKPTKQKPKTASGEDALERSKQERAIADLLKEGKLSRPDTAIREAAEGMPKAYLEDPWIHRSLGMRCRTCRTCMWFVTKHGLRFHLGRCRRNAPTMNGYPVVTVYDWCGEHKLDENKPA